MTQLRIRPRLAILSRRILTRPPYRHQRLVRTDSGGEKLVRTNRGVEGRRTARYFARSVEYDSRGATRASFVDRSSCSCSCSCSTPSQTSTSCTSAPTAAPTHTRARATSTATPIPPPIRRPHLKMRRPAIRPLRRISLRDRRQWWLLVLSSTRGNVARVRSGRGSDGVEAEGWELGERRAA